MVIILFAMATLADTGLLNKYYVPEVQASDTMSTYLYIVNPNDQASDVEIWGFAADGTEFGQSAVISTLAPMGRAWISVADAFPNDFENVGWVQVGGSKALEVFVELWNDGTRSAYWAAGSLTDLAYMPHVAKNTATFSTTHVAVNGGNQGMQSVLRPKPSGSAKILSEHATGFGKAKKDVLEYWSDVSEINWVEQQSNARAAAAMEYFDYIDGNMRRASLALDGMKGKTLRFLHIATNTSTFWTGMVYINVGTANAAITETYYDASGNVLATRTPDALAPNGKVTLLFDANTQDPVPAGSAWLKVESDQDLVGYELFGSATGTADDFFAGLQGNYTSNQVLDYGHFQASNSEWIGYVAVNVGTEAAGVTFHLMDASGAELAQATVANVAPNEKITRLGADLFPNQSGGAWVRATTTGSAWAGFMLWGDHNGAYRAYLSGVNAALRAASSGGGDIPPRTFIEEVEDNNSYATAQVLTPVGGGWNLNVVGEIEQSEQGASTNDYGSGRDDVEDVYKITLTEPTKLLIATATAIAIADIDMFVFSAEVPDGNWFDRDVDFDPVVDYAAAAGADECVARVFQPGTYYIMVSLFEGGAVRSTDYGLLVTSYPLMLETFDNVEAMNNFVQTIFLGTDDTDGQHNWYWSPGTTEGKYGGVAAQDKAAAGGLEISWIVSPNVTPPADGVTVVDFNVAVINPADDPDAQHGLYLKYPDSEDLEFITGFAWNQEAETTPVTFEGQAADLLGYLRWVAAADSVFDYTLEPEREVAIAFLGYNANAVQIWDNIRVFNVATSMPSKTKKGTGSRLVIPNHQPKNLGQTKLTK